MFESLQRTGNVAGFNIPWLIILLIFAWIIHTFIGRILYRGREELYKKGDGIVFNGLVVVLIVWKLSPLVFQFSSVIKNPAALLYLPGGTGGILLGAAAAIVYYCVKVLRHAKPRTEIIKTLVINIAILSAVAALTVSAGGAILSRVNPSRTESAVTAGSEAPVFAREGLDGTLYDLADYRGKTIVINFWASWCPPCRAELPELIEFYNDNESDDDIVFLSVNLFETEQSPEELPKFIEDEMLPYPVIPDRAGAISAMYDVQSIPVTVVVTPDGLIGRIKNGAVTAEWLKAAVR